MMGPSPLTEVIALSREEAEARHSMHPEVCISITDPGRPLAQLRGYREVLRLSFHDCRWLETPTSARQITQADAVAIAQFVAKHWEEVDTVVVHCEAGVSRSVAVALAISRSFGRYWAWPRWYSAHSKDAVLQFEASGQLPGSEWHGVNLNIYRAVRIACREMDASAHAEEKHDGE